MMRMKRACATGALALCVLAVVTYRRHIDAGQCSHAAWGGFRECSVRSLPPQALLMVGVGVWVCGVCGCVGMWVCWCWVMLAVRADTLMGKYDGGGKMSKGLSVQAHDLGWDGGQDYRASGVTYSRLSVSGAPSVSMQASYPEWEDLTSAPPAYGSGVPAYSNSVVAYGSGMQYTTHRMPAYSNSVAAYANLPGSERQRAEFVRDKAAPPASGGGMPPAVGFLTGTSSPRRGPKTYRPAAQSRPPAAAAAAAALQKGYTRQ